MFFCLQSSKQLLLSHPHPLFYPPALRLLLFFDTPSTPETPHPWPVPSRFWTEWHPGSRQRDLKGLWNAGLKTAPQARHVSSRCAHTRTHTHARSPSAELLPKLFLSLVFVSTVREPHRVLHFFLILIFSLHFLLLVVIISLYFDLVVVSLHCISLSLYFHTAVFPHYFIFVSQNFPFTAF